MSLFILIALIVLVLIIIYQIARASELASNLKGEEIVFKRTNRIMAVLLVAFFVLGMYGIWYCHDYMKDMLLPVSASNHGVEYDKMFNTTLLVTGIVFFATHALLFWFCWKYQSRKDRKSYFLSHNNKLEIIWTTVPAIALAILVAQGLTNWFTMTSDAPADAQIVEITGKQFNWIIRYPGADNQLGKRDYRLINDANNVLGMDWTNSANHDDLVVQNGEMHLVVGKPVKLIIGSRDVIHNVGLPHFRMRMDAVPGVMSTLWFTPTITTKEMKDITGNPDFVYEITCAEMCGKGHYSMRGTIIVETQEEYDAYIKGLQTYYVESGNAPQTAQPVATPTESTVVDTTNAVTMN